MFINVYAFTKWASPDLIFGQRNHPRLDTVTIAYFAPLPICIDHQFYIIRSFVITQFSSTGANHPGHCITSILQIY